MTEATNRSNYSPYERNTGLKTIASELKRSWSPVNVERRMEHCWKNEVESSFPRRSTLRTSYIYRTGRQVCEPRCEPGIARYTRLSRVATPCCNYGGSWVNITVKFRFFSLFFRTGRRRMSASGNLEQIHRRNETKSKRERHGLDSLVTGLNRSWSDTRGTIGFLYMFITRGVEPWNGLWAGSKEHLIETAPVLFAPVWDEILLESFNAEDKWSDRLDR